MRKGREGMRRNEGGREEQEGKESQGEIWGAGRMRRREAKELAPWVEKVCPGSREGQGQGSASGWTRCNKVRLDWRLLPPDPDLAPHRAPSNNRDFQQMAVSSVRIRVRKIIERPSDVSKIARYCTRTVLPFHKCLNQFNAKIDVIFKKS